MKEQNQQIESLHGLLDYKAQRFACAEVYLKNALEEWLQVIQDSKLKAVLQKYREMVEEHVNMLEKFLAAEAVLSVSLTNRVMNIFIEDAREQLDACGDGTVRDTCLLSCVQSICHFKISMYGTAAAYAKNLGMEPEAGIFHHAMADEKQIDDRLSQLAEHVVNIKADLPASLEK